MDLDLTPILSDEEDIEYYTTWSKGLIWKTDHKFVVTEEQLVFCENDDITNIRLENISRYTHGKGGNRISLTFYSDGDEFTCSVPQDELPQLTELLDSLLR